MNADESRAVTLSALGLLLDRNLEWSGDFINLRPALCVVLHDNLIAKKPNKHITQLAERLVDARIVSRPNG